MYRNYEEYMQSVLGYNAPNNGNTYMEQDYYDMARVNQNMQDVNSLYPEIYGIVYPVVQKVCSRRSGYSISKEQIEQMVDEVYDVVEPREEMEDTRENVRNGDVKNPRAKETRRPRPTNYLMRDLIKILLLRELLSGGRPGGHMGPGPGGFNPGFMPGMPNPGGPGGPGGMPPIMRPRKSENVLNCRDDNYLIDTNKNVGVCIGHPYELYTCVK